MGRTEKNRGAAMIIVLCVMVIFLALSTTVILAGSVALNTARTNVIYERGKVQATSLSELFVGDLVGRDITEETSTLLRYVRDEIMEHSWPAYDEEKDKDEQADGVVRTFTMDTGEEGEADAEIHQISIEMYWTWDGDAEGPKAEDEESLSSKNVFLCVDVISTLNDIEYHVERKFRLRTLLNEDVSTKDDYPCKWNWEAIGRSPDR